MYQEEMKSSSLAKFLNEYDYVFVDTCSLMEDTFPLFMDKLVASKEYWREDLQLIVLGECVDELKKHAKEKNKERAASRLAAARALKIIRHDRWHTRALTITKTLGESFADNAIYTRVSGLRIHNKLLVITQDKTLTTDLLKMNNLDSQKGRYLSVYRINQESELEKNPGETSLKQPFNKKHDASSFQKVEKDTNKPNELTKLQKAIIQADERINKILSDANVKLKNKIKEVDEQIGRLKKAGEQTKSLKLNFQREDLIAKKSELIKAKAAKKNEKKENFSKENNPSKTGEGKLPSEALRRLALNYNTILRGSSVPYFPEIHGELDLTEDDLTTVDVLGAKGGNFTYKKGDKTYFFVKDKEYSVSLNNKKEEKDNKPKQEKRNGDKAKPLPEKKEPSTAKKEKIQKEKPQAKEDDNLSNKKVKIVKVRGNVSGGSSSAIPEGIILVVGESKKKQNKPQTNKKPQPSRKDEKLIIEARLFDKTLNANLHNPNYPKDKSLKEIAKQKERLKKLKKEDVKDFQLSLSDLEKLEKAKK